MCRLLLAVLLNLSIASAQAFAQTTAVVGGKTRNFVAWREARTNENLLDVQHQTTPIPLLRLPIGSRLRVLPTAAPADPASCASELLSRNSEHVSRELRPFLDYIPPSFSVGQSPPAMPESIFHLAAGLNGLGVNQEKDQDKGNVTKRKKKRLPFVLVGLAMVGAGGFLAATADRGEFSPSVTGGTVGISRREPEVGKFVAGVGLATVGGIVILAGVLR